MFYGENFTFNDISNSVFDVKIINTTGGNILNDVGIKFSRNVSRNDGSTMSPTYTTNDNEPEEITIELCYMNERDIPVSWDEEKINEVENWLILDYFAPFVIEDYPEFTFYLKCTGVNKLFNADNKGVLQFTFKPLTHYAYLIYNETFNVDDVSSGLTINMINPSHLPYRPIIEIINNENSHPIYIGDLVILNFPDNEELIIDNEMLICKTKSGENKLNYLLKDENDLLRDKIDWLELSPGENKINIKGKCKITLKAEFPILL